MKKISRSLAASALAAGLVAGATVAPANASEATGALKAGWNFLAYTPKTFGEVWGKHTNTADSKSTLINPTDSGYVNGIYKMFLALIAINAVIWGVGQASLVQLPPQQ